MPVISSIPEQQRASAPGVYGSPCRTCPTATLARGSPLLYAAVVIKGVDESFQLDMSSNPSRIPPLSSFDMDEQSSGHLSCSFFTPAAWPMESGSGSQSEAQGWGKGEVRDDEISLFHDIHISHDGDDDESDDSRQYCV